MGRTCRICGRSRPHGEFGGKGGRAVICRRCQERPNDEKQRILLTDEVYGYLMQRNISAKNIARLEELAAFENDWFQRVRTLVLEIARVKPGKKRRWKVLRERHPQLFQKIVESELFDAWLDDAAADALHDEDPDEFDFDENGLDPDDADLDDE